MNSSPYYNRLSYKEMFKNIYVQKEVEEHHITRKVLNALKGIPFRIIADKSEIPQEQLNQYTLYLNAPKGSLVSQCPGSKGHICCNYITIEQYMGCTLGCTYCIMKNYLNFSPIIVNVETSGVIADVARLAEANRDKVIRIGTGEVGDSLLYDPLFGLAEELITGLAPFKNVYLELKTKTDHVEHLLAIKDKGNGIIAFSVNPPEIIASEEGIACSLEERMAAAEKAVAAGFKTAFHFDPMFYYSGWEAGYQGVVEQLRRIAGEKVAWISLGTFRYPPGLKEKIDQRWYLYDEFVPCEDKKHRYIQKIRGEIYKTVNSFLKKAFPEVPVYMCMESFTMWEKVFEEKPGKIPGLCTIFNRVDGI